MQQQDALLISTSANLKVEDLRSNSNGSSLLVDVLMPQEMLCNVWGVDAKILKENLRMDQFFHVFS